MEIQPWRQRVLIVTSDQEFLSAARTAFHEESEVVVESSAPRAVVHLAQGRWNVVVVDAIGVDLLVDAYNTEFRGTVA